jgi:hypothetical protein
MSLGEGPAGGRQPSFWQWKHVTNYFGPSFARVASDDDGELIGMRAFMQWQLKSDDQVIRAVRAVDTATHPDCRRMGIFSNLTKRVIDDVTADGVDLVFNTPNNDVLPGYLKLGWQHITIVHPMVKVLNYSAFTLGMLRNKLGRPTGPKHDASAFFRDEPTPVTKLLEQQSSVQQLIHRNERTWQPSASIRTQRSGDYFRWRYAQHPTIPYWAAYLEQNGELEACAIFRTNTRFGLKEVVLCELLLAQPRHELVAQLLNEVCTSVRADYLITFFPESSFQRGSLEKLGFRAVPRQGMNFAVRPLESNLPLDPLQFQNWGLTMGDLELF